MPETSISQAMSMMRFCHCDGLSGAVDNGLVGVIGIDDVTNTLPGLTSIKVAA